MFKYLAAVPLLLPSFALAQNADGPGDPLVEEDKIAGRWGRAFQ